MSGCSKGRRSVYGFQAAVRSQTRGQLCHHHSGSLVLPARQAAWVFLGPTPFLGLLERATGQHTPPRTLLAHHPLSLVPSSPSSPLPLHPFSIPGSEPHTPLLTATPRFRRASMGLHRVLWILPRLPAAPAPRTLRPAPACLHARPCNTWETLSGKLLSPPPPNPLPHTLSSGSV